MLFLPEDEWRGKGAVALVVALLLHIGIAATSARAQPREAPKRLQMEIYIPPPPPPPPEPPPPPKPELPKPVVEKPRVVKPIETPPPPPPNVVDAPPPPTPVPVVAGISMSSTVKGGAAFAVPVGNTTFGEANKVAKDVRAYSSSGDDWKPVRQALLAREASVLRDAKVRYPKHLAEQGIEGAVVLLVEVTKDGRTRSARVAKASGSTELDQLALDAVKKFTWRAAEQDGSAVDSVVRYTYRFELVE